MAYFTSEDEARQREAVEPPEFTEMMAELSSLTVGELSYHDLEQA